MQPVTYPLSNVPLLGKGSIMLERVVAGVGMGLYPLGNCHKLTIDLKDDRATLYSSMNQSASLIASALKKRTPTVKIQGTDFKSDVMAIAMMSSGKSTLAVAANTIAAELLASATAAKAGHYFKTAFMNHDPATNYASTVLKQGATTLVKGTDWVIVDGTTGLIYFPATGGAVVEGTAVTVDYHTLVASFDQVAGGNISTIRGHVLFMPDPTDGQKIMLEIWKVDFSANGSLDLVADDYGNWDLDGNILDDTVNHPLSPFYLATFLN